MNIENVDYSTKIPNNVNLAEDRRNPACAGSLASGHRLVDGHGTEGFQQALNCLHAAGRSIKGWAKFDYVKMPEYRWGITVGTEGRGPEDSVRPSLRRSRLAGRAGQISHCCCGVSSSSRAMSGLGGAAAISAGPRRRSTTCATSSRSMSKKTATSGRWSISCKNISARQPAEELAAAVAAPLRQRRQAAHARRLQRRRPTGCHSTCSIFTRLRQQDAAPWRSRASIRYRAPAASC